jgi:flavin reductase (DIM6/NTAB) family NADH-FMN oxidoreductase RutF
LVGNIVLVLQVVLLKGRDLVEGVDEPCQDHTESGVRSRVTPELPFRERVASWFWDSSLHAVRIPWPKMNPRLRKLLTGIEVPQEYVCLALEDLRSPMTVYATAHAAAGAREVTSQHAFVGYKPAIIVLPVALAACPVATESELCLSFVHGDFAINTRWNAFPTSRNSVARLALRRIREHQVDELRLAFYQGISGKHRFLNRLHRAANTCLEAAKRRPADNVGLPGNLYEQVRIAYSVPRLISLVSLGDEHGVNMFPTDLHGPVGAHHYVSSLRVGGKACAQVERYRRIVISEVDAAIFRQVYALGKNHMRDPAAAKNFDLHSFASASLGVPLPLGVVNYRELEWINYLEVGIHRIYCYRVLHTENVVRSKRLAHVHKYYVQWRQNAGLETQYLLR